MKCLSATISRQVEPAYCIDPTLHLFTHFLSRRIEAQTWDAVDNLVSDLYYSIRDVATEQVEQQALMARTA